MPLSDPNDPSVLWLNLTNIVLGVVMLICCGVIAFAVVREVLARVRSGARLTGALPRSGFVPDDHTFAIPELGLTMADGGEPATKPRRKAGPRSK
jgi:hypothetical protein